VLVVVYCRKRRGKDKDVCGPNAGTTTTAAVNTQSSANAGTAAVSTELHGGTTDISQPDASYLDDDFTRERIIDLDLLPLVLPPYGVDYNEWLATHSAYSLYLSHTHRCPR